MQNIVWKILLIVVVLAVCLLSISIKPMRLGADLRGGVSLVYKVNIPEDASDPQAILARTIAVLKDRVNPKGVYDISMQPMGRDRIEVVMPLPDEEVQGLAKAFNDSIDELLKRSEIRAGELDEALKRGAAPAEFGGDTETERGRKIAELQAVYNEREGSRQAFNDAQEASASDAELQRLAFAAAGAQGKFDGLYAEVLKLSLGEARVTRTLSLPTMPVERKEKNAVGEDVRVLDEDGSPIFDPSQRETALEDMKSEFSHLADLLDATTTHYDAYKAKSTGFDDPQDLMRLMRGAGVLEFHITVSNNDPASVDVDDLRTQLQEIGPGAASSAQAKWYPINELKQWYDKPEELEYLQRDPVNYFRGRDLVAELYQGEHYLLLYTTQAKSMTHDPQHEWSIVQAYPSADRLGRPAVSFELDNAGGSLMGKLTAAHLRKPMAIVLDGQVYSAPTLQSQITTSGIIQGNFSQEEIAYLIKVLAAGSLQAQLSPDPISVSILGPSLGADNLEKGQEAFIISIIAVAVFMVLYYFFAGFVAVMALAANGIIIFGVMIGIDGTFTLPGLAGIVLTIGMAVDANVLIYERIREEIFGGEQDLRGAIRQGYRKALSTILDANITNLIVCMVLFYTATTEVKGFALTLTIGIGATLFTALFVTRQFYYLYTDLAKIEKLSMLATVFPGIHRMLEPNINWIGLRKGFWTFSVIAVSGSAILVWSRGVDMLDTEFRGGVSLIMETATVDEDGDGQPDVVDGEKVHLLLRHSGSADSVEERIRLLGEQADPDSATDEQERVRLLILSEMRNASVLTMGDTTTDADGNVLGTQYQIKVASPKGLGEDVTITEAVVLAIVSEFGNQLDVIQPVAFDGAGAADSTPHVFPITDVELGGNINRPDATQRVPDYFGGVAVLLSNVDPPMTEADAEGRISRMRSQPDFLQYGDRPVRVHGLTLADPTDPSLGYTHLAVVAFDEFRSYHKIDADQWYREVADPEWQLISRALMQPASLKGVSSYSSAVAATLAAQAIVAVALTLMGILVYIWIRFGSLRYSAAAIVALVHDVMIALGLLALSTMVAGTFFSTVLKIEPFRIDLGVVAALLTIIGYSLNDTIVILDRIRENRGKLPLPTAPIVNRSINQTVSRTLLTSVTTLMAVLIMYFEGGGGIRPFTFCLLVGLFVGTYSSVAIAAPLVFTGSAAAGAKSPGDLATTDAGPA